MKLTNLKHQLMGMHNIPTKFTIQYHLAELVGMSQAASKDFHGRKMMEKLATRIDECPDNEMEISTEEKEFILASLQLARAIPPIWISQFESSISEEPLKEKKEVSGAK